MANTYDYVVQTGVIVPDTSDLKTEVENEFKDALGADLDTTSSTPQGRLIEGETIARSNVLATNALVANAINPNTSFGTFLDAVCALTGTVRRSATHTEVLATLTGIGGTVIPAGSKAQTEAGDMFELVEDYSLPIGGTGSAYFQSVDTGPIACAVNTLTLIVTPISGWETINNPVAATIGVDKESDADLRARREKGLYRGDSLIEAISSAVENVDGVLSAYVTENETDANKIVDGVTIAPHSLYVVVDGGSNDNIAKAIWQHKSLGCGYTGTQTVTVYGSYNVPYTVKFNRPTYQAVDMEITVSAPSASNAQDVTADVKGAIADWANGKIAGVDGLGLGVDVSPFEAAAAITSKIPNLFVTDVKLALHGQTVGASTLTMKMYEKATISDSNITVTVNPVL